MTELHSTEGRCITLVLSRHELESIIYRNRVTGEEIVVQVVRIGDGKVRLGTTASREWDIIRDEYAETWSGTIEEPARA